jgi:hypothetical protein
MVFGSGGGSAGEEDFDFFAFGLEFCCRLEERFLAFAVEFNSADGADDKVVRCESVGAAGGVAFVRGDGRKFGEIDSVVEDFDFFGWGNWEAMARETQRTFRERARMYRE